MAEHEYRPSEAVPVSGVYRVEHGGHRETHEATLLRGDVFPSCAICHAQVRFTLKYQATQIADDKDFLARQ
jgi:hypothetical protein